MNSVLIALISAAAALLGVGLTGLITYKTTSRTVSSTEVLAREAREQERKLKAYLVVQRYISRWDHHAQLVVDNVDVLPTIDSASDIIGYKKEAWANLVCSSEVYQQLTAFNIYLGTYLRSLYVAPARKTELLKYNDTVGLRSLNAELITQAKDLITRADNISQLMANELGMRPRGIKQQGVGTPQQSS